MIQEFIDFIESNHNINDKYKLEQLVQQKFGLDKGRSAYYCEHFAVRFSYSNAGFSNTVCGLYVVNNYDDRPFFVCLVKKDRNILFLANSTFLRKISHTSQKLRTDKIRGSFNGSDIQKTFNGLNNTPENFAELLEIHKVMSFEENLVRLVEATNNIVPTGNKFEVNANNRENILNSPQMAKNFVESDKFNELKEELDSLVKKYENEIKIAAQIGNGNIRGNVIEHLIAGEDGTSKNNLISALQNGTNIPPFTNNNELGDFVKDFGEEYHIATDIKTKMIALSSNPKAYNLDKILDFLSKSNSVFMFYFVGIGAEGALRTVLVSMFHNVVLENTIIENLCAGRNSRGVTQLNGAKIKGLFDEIDVTDINIDSSIEFLKKVIAL